MVIRQEAGTASAEPINKGKFSRYSGSLKLSLTYIRWNQTSVGCAACVAKNLPENPTGSMASKEMLATTSQFISAFCNVTSAEVKKTSMERLDKIGILLTQTFESPVEFFKMILLEAPVSLNPPTTSSVAASSTSKPSTSSVPSTFSTLTSIKASSTSTSSAKPIQTPWTTLPPNQAAKDCQGKRSFA